MNDNSNFIAMDEVKNTIEELRKELGKIQHSLFYSLDNFLEENEMKLTDLNNKYNDKLINKTVNNPPIPNNYVERIKLHNVEELKGIRRNILSELDEWKEAVNTISADVTEQDNAMEIIAIYIKKIKLELVAEGVTNPSFNKIFSRMEKTLEDDKKDGYKWLYSTPIIDMLFDYDKAISGYNYSGPALRYYTSFGPQALAPLVKFFIEGDQVREERMKGDEIYNYIKRVSEYNYITSRNADKYYPEKFKREISNKLENLKYIWRRKKDPESGEYSGGYAGVTTNDGKNVTINLHIKDMISDDNSFLLEENNLPDNDTSTQAGVYPYVKAMTHELGHVYDHALDDYSKSEEWLEIYKQIHNEKNSKLLGIYMLNSNGKEKPNEWFARCVDQYIYYPNSKEANIPVTFRGETMSLKDAMGIILS